MQQRLQRLHIQFYKGLGKKSLLDSYGKNPTMINLLYSFNKNGKRMQTNYFIFFSYFSKGSSLFYDTGLEILRVILLNHTVVF